MHCQDGQLFAVFNRHEAHVRAAHRLANGFGIGRIVLVGFDVRFDELRCHQLDGMPQRLKFVSPEVGAAAGLHANQTGGSVAEERHHLLAFEFLVEDLLAVHIDAMDLDAGFCQIDGVVAQIDAA
ncbi:hypothetical protein D3C84_823930 [compost metagenome]